MLEDVLFSVEKQVGMITLNRPKALNALTYDMVDAIFQKMKHWASDPNIHAVVIQSTDERSFCAGGDVRTLYEMGLKKPEAPLDFFNLEYQLNYLIAHYPKPYLPLLHGITFGGGVGLSLHSHYKIASESFIFSMPETSIGFFPDVGAAYILSRINKAYGRYLALTGARLDAKEALSLGLIDAIVKKEDFPALISTLLQEDLSNSPAEKIKLIVSKYATHTDSFLQHQTEIETYFGMETWDSLKSRLATSKTPFEEATFRQLSEKSPLSLAVTFEQLKRAQNLSLSDCLQMDYCLAYHFMHDKDFFEGVRALLVDKDKTPHWSSECNESTIQSYFITPKGVKPLILD